MEHFRIVDGVAVPDPEADEDYLVWAAEQRAQGRWVVDGEDLGELSPEQQRRHGTVVLVMRGAGSGLKRAAGRVSRLFSG